MEKKVEHRIAYLGSSSMRCALGNSTENVFERIMRYESGVKDGFAHTEQHYESIEALAIPCIDEVLENSDVSLATPDTLLILSTTKGNVQLLEKGGAGDGGLRGAGDGGLRGVPEDVFLGVTANKIASHFNAANKPLVISNACISGVSAIIVAQRLVADGTYNNVVVVGADILCPFIVEGFRSFKSLDSNRCKPYDTMRSGLNLGEGCGTVLVTSFADKAVQPVVTVCGGSISNDANHISGPSRTGDGLYFAMKKAVENSGITFDDISFLNMHGTATAYNDDMESKAVNLAGLNDVPLNGLKSYLGHTLGASGVIEVVLAAEQMRRGIVFGTLGYENNGVACPLNVCGEHRLVGGARGTCGERAGGERGSGDGMGAGAAGSERRGSVGMGAGVAGSERRGSRDVCEGAAGGAGGSAGVAGDVRGSGEGMWGVRYALKTASGFGGCNAAVVLAECGGVSEGAVQGNDGGMQRTDEDTGECGGHVRDSSGYPFASCQTGGYRTDECALQNDDSCREVVNEQKIGADSPTLRKGTSLETERIFCGSPAVRKSVSLPSAGARPNFDEFIREKYHGLGQPNLKFFKMDNLAKLGYVAAAELLDDYDFEPSEIGIVLSNHSASLDTDIRHQRVLTSPAVFVYTLPNVTAGEICIHHHIMGENTFFIDASPEFIERYARSLIESGELKAVIFGEVELFKENYYANLKLLCL
ncbi:MAG: beta-ketoacyl synthase [Bacteroidales bacterium]|jgi:3-oxoacyl-[acyl-carrier-protein] synthase-1|nr:beta-ketoacyl synthase [Bacteroidales bacterium]